MTVFTELRLRSQLSEDALKPMWGKLVTDNEYALLLTGPARVLKPNGDLLALFIPGAVKEEMEAAYPILHSLRKYQTNNRGLASASLRVPRYQGSKWEEARSVASAVIGSFDPLGPRVFCRLTAWTGNEWDEYAALFPLFEAIGRKFAEYVPDRFAVQLREAGKTKQEWVVGCKPDCAQQHKHYWTPFTTITVNNTYATGVHVDKGDLQEGFSCLAVMRKGSYTGGRLTFPKFRVAVDFQAGDLLLMDAHEAHGNTDIRCEHGSLNGVCATCGAERISTVCYFRTKMVNCGSAEEEMSKKMAAIEKYNIAEYDDTAELLDASVSKGGHGAAD